MADITLDLDTVEEFEGEVKSFHKGVGVFLPKVFSYGEWNDYVGSTFTKEVRDYSKGHDRDMRAAAENLANINASVPVEAVSYSSMRTKQYIDKLRVKN